MSLRNGNRVTPHKRGIMWVSPLILDVQSHRTSRIEILNHLEELGYAASLVATRSRRKFHLGNSNLDIIQIPLRYVPLISPIFYGILLFLFLPFKTVRTRPRFIIVEFETAPYCIWEFLLAPLLKFKVVLDIRSTPIEISGLRAMLKQVQFSLSVKIAMSLFHGVTIITQAMRKEISERFGLDSNSVGVWSDGVSPELFEPTENTYCGLQLRRKLRLDNKLVVFYHGNLSRQRGVITCVEAMSRIPPALGVTLFLLGTYESETYNAIMQIIKENRLEDSVVIHDPVDYTNVPKYIAMCDVGIVPLPNLSVWRNQCPLKLLEYLAMEKPVIITDIPANREIVGDDKCGIYISSSTASRIAGAIEFVYENKARLKEWGKSGRAIVTPKYLWREVARHLETYLIEVEKTEKRLTLRN